MRRVEERFVLRARDGKGVAIGEIARLPGHDRTTSRATLAQPRLPAPRAYRARRASKRAPSRP